MQPLLASSVMAVLPAWVAQQRWYNGKGRVPVLQEIGVIPLKDPAGRVEINVHLLLDESGRAPAIYQVPLTCRTGRLAGADHALVCVAPEAPGDDDRPGPEANRYYYDAPHDPVFAAALLTLILDEQEVGLASGHRLTRTDPGEVSASHVLVGEQSNTSIILDLSDTLGSAGKPLICKLFRVLQDGQNPDVMVQSTLSAGGSRLVPASVGYVCGQWPDSSAASGLATGHLAFAQEFLPGVEDAWRVACAAVASGADFTDRARSLGQATAEVHAALAEAMGTREATQDDVAALTRSMRARHAAALSEVPALVDYDAMIAASIKAVSSARWPPLQRIHGDYHLGQVLDVPGRGWVMVDFEGEPMRPLAERTQPDLALRDVAGMLRSFDYAAGSWEQEHPGRSAAPWACRARKAFLAGYTAHAGRDPREDAVLLDALELDKVLYEVVYEARNRPTWLNIPITAIARLSAGPRSDLRT